MFCFKRLHITVKKTVFMLSTSVVSVSVVKNVDGKKITDGVTIVSETGWSRVQKMYSRNEFNELSPELAAALNSTYLSFFVGAIYGILSNTREAYQNFILKNQATQFSNAFEARRKLQDRVMMAGFKGFLTHGVKLSMFTGSMLFGTITMLVYTGYSSIFHFAISGGVFGTCYRWKLGPQGMLVGGTLGTILGLVAGMSTKGLFTLTGTSLDDVILFQDQMYKERQRMFFKQGHEDMERTASSDIVELIKEHDLKKGVRENLSEIQIAPATIEIAPVNVKSSN